MELEFGDPSGLLGARRDAEIRRRFEDIELYASYIHASSSGCGESCTFVHGLPGPKTRTWKTQSWEWIYLPDAHSAEWIRAGSLGVCIAPSQQGTNLGGKQVDSRRIGQRMLQLEMTRVRSFQN